MGELIAPPTRSPIVYPSESRWLGISEFVTESGALSFVQLAMLAVNTTPPFFAIISLLFFFCTVH